MNIAFRTDASINIGSGHVMRCLTLAHALKQKGASVFFISRNHPGNLINLIQEQGFNCETLTTAPTQDPPPKDMETLDHAAWLGTSWQEDISQTIDTLKNKELDWLIVDHYALDHRWEKAAKKLTKSIMVIDDLLDREHECDLILDQTFGRKHDAYKNLIPENCMQLMGTDYALLRPEFTQKRQSSLKYRQTPQLKNILINLGGIDKDNVTCQVLTALNKSTLSRDCKITVVMGPNAPWLEQVIEYSLTMKWPTSVKAGVSDMAQLMSDSDLAIGAAGSTSWERCCLGLPTILLVLAENQKAIAKSLDDTKAVIYLKEISDLAIYIEDAAKNLKKLSGMSKIASNICDGHGAERTITYLLT